MHCEQKAGNQGHARRLNFLQYKIEQADACGMNQKLAEEETKWVHAGKGMRERQKAVIERRIVAQVGARPDRPDLWEGKPLDSIVLGDVDYIVPNKLEVKRDSIKGEGNTQQQGIRQESLPGFEAFGECQEGDSTVHDL